MKNQMKNEQAISENMLFLSVINEQLNWLWCHHDLINPKRAGGGVNFTPLGFFLNSSKTVKDAVLRFLHKKLMDNPQFSEKIFLKILTTRGARGFQI